MNRQMKRMQEKAERQQKKAGTDRTSAPASTARRAQTQEKRKRTGARQFLREVRLELKKVDWPSRAELINSTAVVIVVTVVLAFFLGGVDIVLARVVERILR